MLLKNSFIAFDLYPIPNKSCMSNSQVRFFFECPNYTRCFDVEYDKLNISRKYKMKSEINVHFCQSHWKQIQNNFTYKQVKKRLPITFNYVIKSFGCVLWCVYHTHLCAIERSFQLVPTKKRLSKMSFENDLRWWKTDNFKINYLVPFFILRFFMVFRERRIKISKKFVPCFPTYNNNKIKLKQFRIP